MTPLYSVLATSSRSNVPPSNIGEYDVSVGVLSVDIRWAAFAVGARPIAACVKPAHVLCSIVPDAHCQHHCEILVSDKLCTVEHFR